jgi:hypothetical protein
MFKLVRKRPEDAGVYLDEDKLSAALDRRGSKKARSLFREYQNTRSDDAIERLRHQLQKELHRWTPSRIAFYIALAITLAFTVSAISFVLLHFVLHGGVSSDIRKPAVTASASPAAVAAPASGSISDPQISPTPSRKPKSERDSKRNDAVTVTTPSTSNFSEPPMTPRPCASCSAPSLSRSVGEIVGVIQDVLKPVLGVVPELIQSVGEVISPDSPIPGSPAPDVSTPASSGNLLP